MPLQPVESMYTWYLLQADLWASVQWVALSCTYHHQPKYWTFWGPVLLPQYTWVLVSLRGLDTLSKLHEYGPLHRVYNIMEPASDGKLPFLDTCTYQEWTTHQSCHIWHTWHSSVSGVWLQPSSESQKIGRLIILITKAPFVTTATKRGCAKLYSG